MIQRLNRLIASLAVLALPLLLRAQTSQNPTPSDLSAILERLDRLERENRALTDEVRELRAKLDRMAESAPSAPSIPSAAPAPPVEPTTSASPPEPSTAEKLEVLDHRVEEQAQTKVEASQKFPIRLAGIALFNAFLNSRQSDGVEYPTTAQPTGPRSAGATIRQTIIGLEYHGPATFLGGSVHGSVFMDFFPPVAQATIPGQTIRLRTGSIEIDWKHTSIMVGQEKPIFNPREPSSLAQLGVSPFTGAGNLWLWLPQVRVEQDVPFGGSTGLRAQLGVVQTRELGPYTGTPFNGVFEPVRPGYEGRFEFFHNFDDERRIEIAPGFHVSQTHANGSSIPSRVISTDWLLRSHWLELTGAFFTGKNIAPLGSGYQQGFGFYSWHLAAVASIGGWAQLTVHATRRLDFHLFSGQQDDNNMDLNEGRIGKNLLYGGNLYYRLAPNVLLSLETTQLRTLYLGQGVRINNHYDVALGYFF